MQSTPRSRMHPPAEREMEEGLGLEFKTQKEV